MVNATAPDAPTILLVEDEAASVAELTRVLTAGGCTVWHAESAGDARAVLKHRRPDLIVLDLTLPDVDGLVFCTQLKIEAPDVPFVICSQATTAEKVLGFKLGAEDVVAKPYELAELEARLEAVLRRRPSGASAAPAPVLGPRDGSAALANGPAAANAPGLGALRVDLAHWRVTLDDRPLELTPTEFQLLVYLSRRAGEIISRQELARGVWGDESMSRSRTIDAYVRRIGAKLTGRGAPRILSIRGMGYQLALPLVTAA
jgi:DNA-binding response OmpR family regulator